MNELQIRLTADIQGLQSALAKAKQTLKSFETETSTDSEKSNVGFRRKIGLIEQLNAKAKQLKVSLSQATNEKQIAGFNAELEQTTIELTRLNALGKSFANTSTQSFNNFRVSAGAAGGSAIAFNRIIQDAPFGIIGVGNNIQQFAEQLSALRVSTGSTGAALKTFFSSLFTGSNLVILAVSAVTAAFTAYQLGVFDSAKETKDLNKELEDYKNNLDGVSKAQLDGVQSAQKEIQALQLLKAQAENDGLSREKRLLAVKELKKEWPEYLKGFSDEEILLGKVGNAYIELTKKLTAYSTAQALSATVGENNAKAAILQFQEEERSLKILAKRAELEKAKIGDQTNALKVAGQFTATNIEANRIESELNDLIQETTDSSKEREKLAFQNLSLNKKINEEIAKAGGLIEVNNDKVKENNRELNYWELIQDRINEKTDIQKKILTDLAIEQKRLFEQITRLNQQPISFLNAAQLAIASKRLAEIDKIIGSIASKRTETEITIDESKLEGLEKSLFGKGKVQALEEEIVSLQARIKVTVDPEALERYKQQLITAQDALSDLLGKRKLQVEDLTQAFVGLGSVIGRAFKNPQLGTFVSQFATFVGQIVAGAFAVAKANAVAGATQSSLFTGPAAAFTLPAFVASAVGVVASAFAALGNFGGGGTSPQGGVGSTYTNREFGGPVSKGRAYIVGERRPELFVPNTNGIIVPQLPSMDYSGARVNSSMYGVEVMLKGPDDLLFFVEQAQIRRGLR